MDVSRLLRLPIIEFAINTLKDLHNDYANGGLQTTVNQILFCLTAEKVICPNLLHSWFYSWIVYAAVAYIEDTLEEGRRSNVIPSDDRLLLFVITLTVVCAPIVYLAGKADDTIVLSRIHTIVTLIYFLITHYAGRAGEKTAFVSLVKKLNMHVLEGLEEFWIPALFRIVSTLMSVILAVFAFYNGHWLLAMLMIYTNIYLSALKTLEHGLAPLTAHRLDTTAFPLVMPRHLRERDDRTCPVCTDEMRPFRARITPCRHMFHAYCLTMCKQRFGECPMCKHPL